MNSNLLKDAKLNFIETGRLNRNIVRNEVALSWYKCNINQMKIEDTIKEYKCFKKNQYEEKYLDFVDAMIPIQLDYYLCDQHLKVEQSRTLNYEKNQIMNVDEMYIGTNGAAITKKTNKVFAVNKEEHFLNSLNAYITVGIPLKKEEHVYGYLMLLSDHTINEFVIRDIEQSIKSYHEKGITFFTRKDQTIQLEDYIVYPTSRQNELQEQIEKLKSLHQPILVQSSKGNGKTSLAWYLLLSQNLMPELFNASETPVLVHEFKLKKILNEYDTVILDNLQDLDISAGKHLIEYIENFYRTKNKTVYKCKKIVFTMDINCRKLNPTIKKIHDRIHNNKINLTGLQEIETFDCQKDVALKLQKRCKTTFTSEEIIKKLKLSRGFSFKTFIERCLLSENAYDIKDLESMEYEYIKEVYTLLDGNASLTADKLQISRSTLYRKLNKHQNKSSS